MGKITVRELTQRITGSDIWLSDDAPKGAGRFCARITRSGEQIFYFRYTSESGERVRLPLGRFDATGKNGLTLDAARTKAGELSKLYQSGVKNVREHLEQSARLEQARLEAEEARHEAEKAAAEAEQQRISKRRTVEQAARQWFAAPGKRSGQPKSTELIRRFERDVFPKIGALALEDVKKGDLRTLLEAIETRGARVLARHMIADLRQFFDYCVSFDWIDASPAASIKRTDIGAKAEERARVLSEAEVRALPQALKSAHMARSTELAIWVMLSTSCRVGELSKARWEDVDLNARTWKIPEDIAKNGHEHTVFLSPFAVRCFEELRPLSGMTEDDAGNLLPCPWVLPAKHHKEHVCEKSIAKQIGDRQRGDRGAMSNRTAHTSALMMPGGKWTPHDLRRTAATMMTALGVLPEVVERCLNHLEQNRMKRIYQRHDYAPEMREAWRLLGDRLELLTSAAENVVTLKPRTAA
ncbi:site-specific integrase [Niveibacterium umoris]|uniref:Integrase n=1 Tax=Niveibacterium umoris TaxID=1193620 RepID=A0A840BKD0_9RHOO|nr:site-specific integrase [Niveibacterium umoris]MBB4012038.1 integrase [Niveibacterium umoris]